MSPTQKKATSHTKAEDKDDKAESKATKSEEKAEEKAKRDEEKQQAEQAAEDPGVLAGTATEQAPGVGGIGDHPAPAVMLDPERGGLHVAGEAPSGTGALGQAPEGDEADVQAGGDVTDEENEEKLNAVTEPEQVDIERPDIGTE